MGARAWFLGLVLVVGCADDKQPPAGCFIPCADNRDCDAGLRCVDLHWINIGGCTGTRTQGPACVATACPLAFGCVNDLPLSDDYCSTDQVARVEFHDGAVGVDYLLGRELLYCPNGCEDTCSAGGCDDGQQGRGSHCR